MSPAQLELARQVIKASHFDSGCEQTGAQLQQMSARAMDQTIPNPTPEQKKETAKTMEEITKSSLDLTQTLLRKAEEIYAEVYTEAELRGMLAFFESAEGKALQEKQPEILQRMRQQVVERQTELVPKIQQLIDQTKARLTSSANLLGTETSVLNMMPMPAGPSQAPASAK